MSRVYLRGLEPPLATRNRGEKRGGENTSDFVLGRQLQVRKYTYGLPKNKDSRHPPSSTHAGEIFQ